MKLLLALLVVLFAVGSLFTGVVDAKPDPRHHGHGHGHGHGGYGHGGYGHGHGGRGGFGGRFG